MADETKAPQIENPEKITVKDLAEMVKMRYFGAIIAKNKKIAENKR